MDKQVEKTFFKLLCSAITDTVVEIDDNLALNDDFIKALCSLAKKHDLIHIISYALINNGYVDKNSKFYKPLLNEQFSALSRSEKNSFALNELCDIFEKEKVSYIPLKGAVIKEFYPKPWFRTSCDIDVLVKKESVETVAKILEEGYNYTVDGNATTHDYGFITPNGTRLELHFSLGQEEKFPLADEILQKAWEYSIKDDAQEYKRQLSYDFLAFYHIVHMAKHFLNGGCGIKPFIDLYFIRKNKLFDEQKLVKFLDEGKLLRFYQGAVKLIGVWFNGENPDKTTLNMSSYILKGGVYGDVDNYATVNASKGQGKVKTFFSLMFLPRKNLELLYPNLKKHPILLPFYQVKRWFKVFNKKSRKNAQGLIKASANVSGQRLDVVSSMMKDLGL